VAQEPDEHAVLDQVGAPGRQALAGDPLGSDEAGQGAVIVDAELGDGDGAAELAEKRRARRVERPRMARREDEVVQEVGDRLAAEDDRVVPRRHPTAADGGDRIGRRLAARLVGEVVEACARRPP